jgi:hypothetical protein
MRGDHQRLLRAAGFGDITELDVTAAFAAAAAAWLVETEPHAEELARLEPPGAFAQRQADRRRMLTAIRAGCCAARSSSPEQHEGPSTWRVRAARQPGFSDDARRGCLVGWSTGR